MIDVAEHVAEERRRPLVAQRPIACMIASRAASCRRSSACSRIWDAASVPFITIARIASRWTSGSVSSSSWWSSGSASAPPNSRSR